MQTQIRKEFTQAFKVIALGLMLGLGVSIASADWTAPVSSAPTCATGNPGCDAPVNVSTAYQSKGVTSASALNPYTSGFMLTLEKQASQTAGLLVDGIVNAANLQNNGSASVGGAVHTGDTANKLNVYGAGNFDVSSLTGSAGTVALSLKSNLNSGAAWEKSVTIASPNASNLTIYDNTNQQPMSLRAQDGKFNGQIGIGPSFNISQAPAWRSGGVDVDLSSGRGSGVDAFSIKSSAGQPSGNLVLQNTPAFRIYSDASHGDATIWAGAAKFTSGNPAPGKFLAATDTNGNSTWQTPIFSGGGIDIIMTRDKTSANVANASCNAGFTSTESGYGVIPAAGGYTVVGGGGDCANTFMLVSQPQSNGWHVQCQAAGNVASHATAICMKFTQPTLGAQASWHHIALGNGSPSQSCASYVAGDSHYSGQTGDISTFWDYTASSTPSLGESAIASGSCAYTTGSANSGVTGAAGSLPACVAGSSTSGAYPVAACGYGSLIIRTELKY